MRRWPDAPIIRYLTLGNSELLLVLSPAASKEVLQTKCYSFVKPELFARLIGDIVGKGILFTEGDEHKTARKLISGKLTIRGSKTNIG